jgi:mutator protein MutT
MRNATLCLLVRGDPLDEILLGLKKAGFGAGKYNGFGGKIEPGETATHAAVREIKEEVGIKVSEKDLRQMARLTFVFPADPTLDHDVCVFLVTRWEGDPVESAEMKPCWFTVDDIPFGQMWQDDILWLPRILAGEQVRGYFTFGDDGETLASWRLERWDGAGGTSDPSRIRVS